MLRIGKEKKTFFYDPRTQPVARASVKDTVLFETVDCFDDQLKTEKDLAHTIDMSHMNPNTGPLFINNAQPGDILVVQVLDIEPEDHAVTTLIPGEGVLNCISFGFIPCALMYRSTTSQFPLSSTLVPTGISPRNVW